MGAGTSQRSGHRWGLRCLRIAGAIPPCRHRAQNFRFPFFLSFDFAILPAIAACAYPVRLEGGNPVSSQQVQRIELGKSNEADLLRLLGSPTKRERRPDGTDRLLYVHSAIKSPTLEVSSLKGSWIKKRKRHSRSF